MKLKRYLWIALIVSALTTSLALDVAAQDRPVWQGGVSFRDGTVIKMGVGFVPAGALEASPSTIVVGKTLPEETDSHAFIRILKLDDGRVAMYEIRIKPQKQQRQFEVKLRSVTSTPQVAKEWGVDPARVQSSFLRNYEVPIIVDNGDTLAIEVMQNPRTSVKLVDYFLISDHPVPEVENNRQTLAKQARVLTTEDIELSLFGFEVRKNGKSIFKSGGGIRGRFIWLDMPDTGRFIFSLTPNSEAAGFSKAAYVTSQQISFTHGADQYDLITNEPIIHASGVYDLWMLFDPTFTLPMANLIKGQNGFVSGAADNFPGVKGVKEN